MPFYHRTCHVSCRVSLPHISYLTPPLDAHLRYSVCLNLDQHTLNLGTSPPENDPQLYRNLPSRPQDICTFGYRASRAINACLSLSSSYCRLLYYHFTFVSSSSCFLSTVHGDSALAQSLNTSHESQVCELVQKAYSRNLFFFSLTPVKSRNLQYHMVLHSIPSPQFNLKLILCVFRPRSTSRFATYNLR